MAGVEQVSVSEHTVLHGERLPWALAATICCALGSLVYLTHAEGIVGDRVAANSDIFFGTLIAGFLPRACPGIVQARLDSYGLTLRDVLRSEQVPWLDVLGPFAVIKRPIGSGVTFMRRSHGNVGAPFWRVTLYNTYGLPPEAFADTLNAWRHRFLDYVPSSKSVKNE